MPSAMDPARQIAVGCVAMTPERRQLMRANTRRELLMSATGALGTCGLMSATQADAQDEDSVPVVSLRIVTLDGAVKVDKQPFSVCGIVADTGFRVFNLGVCTAVVDLGGKFRCFEAVAGMVDGQDPFPGNEAVYKVALDGKTISYGKVPKQGKPVFLKLNVTDGRSLTFTMAAAAGIGNPSVSSKEVLVEIGGMELNDRPTLLSPSHRARGMAAPIQFKWKPMPHASAYVVQVLLKKRLGKLRAPDKRMWSFTVSRQMTQYQWDFMDAPSGEYGWSVLAFDEDTQLGTFSDERTFTLAL